MDHEGTGVNGFAVTIALASSMSDVDLARLNAAIVESLPVRDPTHISAITNAITLMGVYTRCLSIYSCCVLCLIILCVRCSSQA